MDEFLQHIDLHQPHIDLQKIGIKTRFNHRYEKVEMEDEP